MGFKLDKLDKRILFELDKNARIPDTKLAKILGRSKESTRYRIKKLKEKEVIKGFTTWIDPIRLGFITAKIYMNVANRPNKKKELMEFVRKDKRLFWLGVAEGSWNIGLTYFVKSNEEFFHLKNELFSKFKGLILDSNTGVVVDVNICDKTFLYGSNYEWHTFLDKWEENNLDRLEKNILRQLFENSRKTMVDIAYECKSTVDIVRYRIKKLEKKRIIFRYVAVIDFSAIGYESFKSFLYFTNLTKKDERDLREYCRKHPKIIHLARQITPWDIELEMACEGYSDYNEIISDLTKEFVHIINRVETAIMSQDNLFPAKKMVFE